MLAQCPACRISIRVRGLITPLDKKTPHPTKKTQINQNLFTFLLTILCKRKKFPTRLITQYAEGDEAWNGEQEVIFSLIHKNSSFEGFHEWSEHHTHTHTNTRLRSHAWILVIVIMDWLIRHRQSQCRFLWRLDLRFCICFDFNYSDWSGFLFNLFITFYLLLLQLGDRQTDRRTDFFWLLLLLGLICSALPWFRPGCLA